jgi:hypothetical protein
VNLPPLDQAIAFYPNSPSNPASSVYLQQRIPKSFKPSTTSEFASVGSSHRILPQQSFKPSLVREFTSTIPKILRTKHHLWICLHQPSHRVLPKQSFEPSLARKFATANPNSIFNSFNQAPPVNLPPSDPAIAFYPNNPSKQFASIRPSHCVLPKQFFKPSLARKFATANPNSIFNSLNQASPVNLPVRLIQSLRSTQTILPNKSNPWICYEESQQHF